ncbi:MAG: efflux RND transporter periplasmic adaptor subunit [Ignavibacteria bacterium]|nr:efflux RND transporter periplasmic adaptor subunit [Ignavibacteria bacterium]
MEVKNADLSSLKINRNAPEPGSNNTKNILKYSVITLVVIVVLIFLYNVNKFFGSKEIEVGSATVSLMSQAQTSGVLTANGYVVAQRKAAVASKGTGRLVYLGVVEGDKVQKDQIIARLEDNDIKAQLEQARANQKVIQAELKNATNNYNRIKSLVQSKAVTQAELDAAEARYLSVQAQIEVAKAQVNSAEVALDNTLIRAPFNGTVLTKNADVGEIVAPFAASASSKAAVVTLADMMSLQVEADVSESNLERIAMNQDCEIAIDAYGDKRYQGYVAKIVPTADRSKATVMVKVGFKNYDVKVLPEMSAKVIFLGADTKPSEQNVKPILTVPSSALFNKNGEVHVFKLLGEEVKEVVVTTGKKMNSFTEILSGLTEGDKVVSEPVPDLKSGSKVKIK